MAARKRKTDVAAATDAPMTSAEPSIGLNDREVLVTGGTGSFGQRCLAGAAKDR